MQRRSNYFNSGNTNNQIILSCSNSKNLFHSSSSIEKVKLTLHGESSSYFLWCKFGSVIRFIAQVIFALAKRFIGEQFCLFHDYTIKTPWLYLLMYLKVNLNIFELIHFLLFLKKKKIVEKNVHPQIREVARVRDIR